MWKRIQTLLIFITTALLFCMFWMDMCKTTDPETGARFSIGFYERSQFLIFTFTTFMLSIFAIFHYNKRLTQIRICLLNSIMLFAYQLWILVEFFLIRFDGITLSSQYTLGIASIFPVICIILNLIAIRYIGKDEIYYAVSLIGSDNQNNNTKKKQ